MESLLGKEEMLLIFYLGTSLLIEVLWPFKIFLSLTVDFRQTLIRLKNVLGQTESIFMRVCTRFYISELKFVCVGPLITKPSVAKHDTFSERVHFITRLSVQGIQRKNQLNLLSHRLCEYLISVTLPGESIGRFLGLVTLAIVDNGRYLTECWLKCLDSLASLQTNR